MSGCTCSEVRVDAHIKDRVSQVYLVKMEVSQSAACEVEVEVLPDSRSGEHKFKVGGGGLRCGMGVGFMTSHSSLVNASRGSPMP